LRVIFLQSILTIKSARSFAFRGFYIHGFPRHPQSFSFRKSYDIYFEEEKPEFATSWIFINCDMSDLDALPQETTMQRAAIKYLKEKRPIGWAGGVLKEEI